MATDKKTAARRLIHNAIRQTFSGEDPLAVHLVAMSCYDLLREYAEAKGIQLKANSLNNVREDVRKSVVDAVKLIHRFSKHARDDADETIDEAKIVPFADMTLLMVIRCMRSVFLRARAI